MEINVPASTEHTAQTEAKTRYFDAQSSALLQQLVRASPAQVRAYMNNNVNTLAQARDVLEALALAVRYLYLKAQEDNP